MSYIYIFSYFLHKIFKNFTYIYIIFQNLFHYFMNFFLFFNIIFSKMLPIFLHNLLEVVFYFCIIFQNDIFVIKMMSFGISFFQLFFISFSMKLIEKKKCL